MCVSECFFRQYCQDGVLLRVTQRGTLYPCASTPPPLSCGPEVVEVCEFGCGSGNECDDGGGAGSDGSGSGGFVGESGHGGEGAAVGGEGGVGGP